MNALPIFERADRESRLLFVLLDAAHCDGMMPGPLQTRWLAAKRRIAARGSFEAEGELFLELLDEMESHGTLAGSWIRARWFGLKSRLALPGFGGDTDRLLPRSDVAARATAEAECFDGE